MLFSGLARALSNEFEFDMICVMDQHLQNLRLLGKGMKIFQENILYIGSYQDFDMKNVMYKNFCFFDYTEEDYLKSSRNNILWLKSKSDFVPFFNRAQDIITADVVKMFDLNYQKLFTTGSLDELLNQLSDILSNPVALLDFGGNILAHTDHEHFYQSPIWLEMLSKGYCNIKLDYAALNNQIIHMESLGEKHSCIVCPVNLRENQMVILVVAGLFTGVSHTQFDIIKTGAQILKDTYRTDILNRHSAEFSLEDSLRRLISGNKHIKIGRELLNRSLFLSPNEGFFVLVMNQVESTAEQRKIINRFRMIEDTIVFVYQEHIVCFAQHTQPVVVYMENVNRAAKECKVVIGVSQPFSSLQELKDYYQQAASALDYAILMRYEPGIYHIDYFCFLNPFVHAIDYNRSKNDLLREYCGSIVWYLKLYDDEMGTEYFETLRQFVYTDRNYKECAGRLNIHRNTLSYRLSQISTILGERNLFAPDMFFMLSYCFRLYDYLDIVL